MKRRRPLTLTEDAALGGVPYAVAAYETSKPLGTWTVAATAAAVAAADVEDIVVLCHFEAS